MGDLLPILITAAIMAAVMAGFWLLAVHVRRRGMAGAAVRAALASYDEAFHATAHQSHYEIRAQAERKTPAPSPDGRWTRHRSGAASRAATHRPFGSAPRRAGRLRRAIGRWASRAVRRR
jgi:hypothetical protein